MVRKTYLAVMLSVAVSSLLQSCKDDDVDSYDNERPKATVSMLVTTNGLGDNGYNDDAAKGIFSFANRFGLDVSLLRPRTVEEAREMYVGWTQEHSEGDSAVLVVGSSYYEEMLRGVGDLSGHEGETDKTGGSRRVLLYETKERDMPKGVSTLYMNRRGVCYLAGCMSKGSQAIVMVADRKDPIVADALNAFKEAYESHKDDGLEYTEYEFGDDETGFAKPDEAYFLTEIVSTFTLDGIVFPLLGGSTVGVIRYLNNEQVGNVRMIGMDVDQNELCQDVAFSVGIYIGVAINWMLEEWLIGEEWDKLQVYGMEDGLTEIILSNDLQRDEQGRAYKDMMNEYYQEAIEEDRKHAEKLWYK